MVFSQQGVVKRSVRTCEVCRGSSRLGSRVEELKEFGSLTKEEEESWLSLRRPFCQLAGGRV